MNLARYLATLTKSQRAAFARRVDSSPSHLRQVARGHRPASRDLWDRVIEDTGGLVERPDSLPARPKRRGTHGQSHRPKRPT